MRDHKLLGVLGGLGPASTIYFCELLNQHTKATCDGDHIDMLISSRASTPDRTAFILGQSQEDPLPVMIEEAHRLERAGADLLVIPCNTAHYFYEGLTGATDVPILNIIEKTVEHLVATGVSRFGLLATEGTVCSGAYSQVASKHSMTCLTPDATDQALISSMIYDRIKQNKSVDMNAFSGVAERLLSKGAEKLVLGCTELSLLKKDRLSNDVFVDSLEVLAHATICACAKTAVGFPDSFDVQGANV